MKQISNEELHEALRRAVKGALAKLAPVGGERSVGVNAICDCLVVMTPETRHAHCGAEFPARATRCSAFSSVVQLKVQAQNSPSCL